MTRESRLTTSQTSSRVTRLTTRVTTHKSQLITSHDESAPPVVFVCFLFELVFCSAVSPWQLKLSQPYFSNSLSKCNARGIACATAGACLCSCHHVARSCHVRMSINLPPRVAFAIEWHRCFAAHHGSDGAFANSRIFSHCFDYFHRDCRLVT